MTLSAFHIFPDPDGVAEAAAEQLLATVAAAENVCHVALSGGSTPKLLFQLLATPAYQERMDWDKLHLYWGDERCVPWDHSDSNYGQTRQLLLDRVPIPAGQVHPIDGAQLDPAAEARRYSQLLWQHLPVNGSWPSFDLIFLGMGADGHTASIFPDQMNLLYSSACCAVAIHPESGQRRVSLTGQLINAARQVTFLVTGKDKAPKVNAIRNQQPGFQHYPAAHIHPAGCLDWYLDAPASM